MPSLQQQEEKQTQNLILYSILMQNITTTIRNYLAHGLGPNHLLDIFKEVSKYDPEVEYEQVLNRIRSRVDLFQLNDDATVLLKQSENNEVANLIGRLQEKFSNITEPENLFLLIVYHIALGRYAKLELKRKKGTSIYGEYNSTLAYKGIIIPDKVFLNIGGITMYEVEELLDEYDEIFWEKIGGGNTLSLIEYLFRTFNNPKKGDWMYPSEFRIFIKELFPQNAKKILLAAPSAHQTAIELLIKNPELKIVIWEANHYTQTIYRLFFDIAGVKRVYFTKTLPIDFSTEFEVKWSETLIENEIIDFAFLDVLAKSEFLETKNKRIDFGIINTLNDLCRECVVVVPESYLFNNHPIDARDRNELLLAGNFVKISSLPEKVFTPYARIKTSIVYFSNVKNDAVKFEYYNSDTWNKFRLSQNLSDINNIKLNASVPLSKLIESDNLSASRFCLPEVEVPGKAVMLKDITSGITRGMHVLGNELKEGIPVVTYKDLSDENQSIYLNSEGFSKFASATAKNDPRKNRALKKGSILLAAIGPKLKPTVFNSDNTVYSSGNLLSLTIDQSKAIPEYVALELRKPYVKEQIDRFGFTLLRRADLETIRISLPSLSEQRKIAFQEFDSATKIDDSAIREIVGIVKHRLSTPVATVNLGLKNLNDFIQNLDQTPFTANTIIHPHPEYLDEIEKEKYSLKNSVNSISLIAEGIQSILKKLDQVTKLEKDQMVLSEIAFKNFIESKIIPLFAANQVQFEINADYQSINADETQLEFLLINLIENAIKHGKEDNERLKVVLQLSLEKIDTEGNDSVAQGNLILSVANNGKPLPDGFNKEAFIKKFSKSDFSSGNGLGGYIVNKIVSNHKGELEILDEKNTTIAAMKVQFNVNLPTE